MCDMGEDETVEHMVLQYEKYGRDNGHDASSPKWNGESNVSCGWKKFVVDGDAAGTVQGDEWMIAAVKVWSGSRVTEVTGGTL